MKVLASKWVLFIGAAVLLTSLWFTLTIFFIEEEKKLRRQLRETVKETFPQQTAEYSKTVGLFYFNQKKNKQDEVDLSRKSVVLVHGLDDPGKVWSNLAPELVKENCNVWILNYPNDQPVVESSLLFFDELKQLRMLGVDSISIVSHSMGGLVSRELLTSPDIGYDKAADTDRIPEVKMLIMVGTPNHGSQLARFRFFAELRDHFVRLTKGQSNWLGVILDGAGEAKIDLLPDSRFLTELNGRSHPEGVDMLIIAGITSPWSENDIDNMLGKVEQNIASIQQQDVETMRDYLVSMTHGLGDGLVTVESTRLDRVPYITVNGTHLSMIRNITENSQRVPPAVPIIVEKLFE